eukprot:TRINITY_DN599_c0_g1_i2.p1 TRINITY_DN599_c0_g1~~TRINITY_DN599_c0_g1_i2.p1  ORF type:complete len:516 (+),score=261.83 TRINITY_DN599_c0_g1_i2:29-1549(+)
MSNASDISSSSSSEAPFDLSFLQLSKIPAWKLGLLAGGVLAGFAILGYFTSPQSNPEPQTAFDENVKREVSAAAPRSAPKKAAPKSEKSSEALETRLREMMKNVEPLNLEKKFDQVEKIYRDMILLITSEDPSSHLLGFVEEGLGEVLMKLGQNAEAEKHITKAISIWEEHDLVDHLFEAQLTLVQLISKTHTRLDEAEMYIQMFMSNPNMPQSIMPRYFIELANTKSFKNEFVEAAEIFGQIIGYISTVLPPNDPNVVIIEINLASIKIYQGLFEEGNALFDKAIETFSGNTALLRYTLEQAARVNWEMKNFEAAEKHFTTLLKESNSLPDSDAARIHSDFANFYWDVDHPRKSEVLFDKLRGLESPPKVTSRVIITNKAALVKTGEGFVYNLNLRMRIKRQQGVRAQYIIPQGAVLEIQYENLDREDGPDSDEPEFITKEVEVNEAHTTAGEVPAESPVFKKFAGVEASARKNFEVIVTVWEDSSKKNKLGQHHQLVSLNGIAK